MPSNIVRTPIIRKAIKIKRQAVKLVNYRQRLAELSREYVTSDLGVMRLVKHYEMLARNFKKQTWYDVLGGKGKNHRNWGMFVKLFDFCKLNGYDGKHYIEAQFHRAGKYWNDGRYPLPNMLLGEKASKWYVNYVKDLKEKYSKDVHADEKMASKQTISVQSQVLQDVAESVKTLKFYMGTIKTIKSPEHIKVSIIYSFWTSFSPYYLYSVPWFRKYVDEMISNGEEHSGIKQAHDEFARIDKSKQLQQLISEGVEVAEDELSIPRNISLLQ